MVSCSKFIYISVGMAYTVHTSIYVIYVRLYLLCTRIYDHTTQNTNDYKLMIMLFWFYMLYTSFREYVVVQWWCTGWPLDLEWWCECINGWIMMPRIMINDSTIHKVIIIHMKSDMSMAGGVIAGESARTIEVLL